jgi:triacylglycerol lipase
VIRDDYFMMNHIDQTNMIFGLVAPLGAKPIALFRAHGNRLRNEGL